MLTNEQYLKSFHNDLGQHSQIEVAAEHIDALLNDGWTLDDAITGISEEFELSNYQQQVLRAQFA